jgi:hypothetical protein
MAEVNAALQQLFHIDNAQFLFLLVFSSAEIIPLNPPIKRRQKSDPPACVLGNPHQIILSLSNE